jgi:manganese oxidase
MMTGTGPFGSVEMGGMFSMLKVRAEQPPGDYRDPGWFKHPPGSVAFEYKAALAEPARFAAEGGAAMPVANMPAKQVEVQVRKPGAKRGRHAR